MELKERVTYSKPREGYSEGVTESDVLLDGKIVGRVEKERTTTVRPYAGKTYGEPVSYTAWSARSVAGVEYTRRVTYFEHRSRKAAVADLLTYLPEFSGQNDYALSRTL